MAVGELFQDRLCTALLDTDEAREAAWRAPTTDPEVNKPPPAGAVLLARALKSNEMAVTLLRAAAVRHAGDVWVNYILAERLGSLRPASREEPVRYDSVAPALRPSTAHAVARLFDVLGRTNEAIGAFADLVVRQLLRGYPPSGGTLVA